MSRDLVAWARREFLRALDRTHWEIVETLHGQLLPVFRKAKDSGLKGDLREFDQARRKWAAHFNLEVGWINDEVLATLEDWRTNQFDDEFMDWHSDRNTLLLPHPETWKGLFFPGDSVDFQFQEFGGPRADETITEYRNRVLAGFKKDWLDHIRAVEQIRKRARGEAGQEEDLSWQRVSMYFDWTASRVVGKKSLSDLSQECGRVKSRIQEVSAKLAALLGLSIPGAPAGPRPGSVRQQIRSARRRLGYKK
jgi:hypothetical protein